MNALAKNIDYDNNKTRSLTMKTLNVLIVDDDFEDFFSVKRVLERSGRLYQVTHVADFEQAQQKLICGDYHVALLDFHIGKYSADELIRSIGPENLRLPVIFLTGQDSQSVKKSALDLGAFDFIDKLELGPEIISRSIDFAIQRYSIEARLRDSEARLIDAIRDAEEANHAKSHFLAQMSHELRTPLNAIIGFSEVLSNDILNIGFPEQYREYSSLINSSGQHLLSLVNDLLDIAKIESGNAPLEKKVLNPKLIVDDAIALNRRAAEENGVIVHPQITTQRVFADKRALMQVLVNLMSNAIKFSHPSGVVEIRCAEVGGETVFEVQDYGVGIRQEEIEKAISPFEQTESSSYCQGKSTGLGLSISKSLVELHDGALELASEHGKGTTVSIALPVPE